MELDELSKVIKQADLLWDEQQLVGIYAQMANQISNDLSQTLPVVLCVMNGGLFLTAELLKRLDFPLELDYVHLSRYRGETTGGEVEWQRYPSAQIKGRDVLIIDDILDEGLTLKVLQAECKKQGAQSVRTAVLAVKQHDRQVEGVELDYSGLTVEDRYVFGCGMDYQGYFRNLSGIYALGESG